MNEDQRAAWRKALAARAPGQRLRQYRPRARGVQAVRQAGMVRRAARRRPSGEAS